MISTHLKTVSLIGMIISSNTDETKIYLKPAPSFSHSQNHPIWDSCKTFYLCEIRPPSRPPRHYIGSPSTKPRTKIRSASWHKCISLACSPVGAFLDLHVGFIPDVLPDSFLFKHDVCNLRDVRCSFFSLLRRCWEWWFLIIKIYLKACMNPLVSLKHLDGKRKCFLAMLVSWTFVTSFVSLPYK